MTSGNTGHPLDYGAKMTISLRLYCVIGAAVVTCGAVGLMAAFRAPLLIGVPVLLVLAAVALSLASRIVHYGPMFRWTTVGGRREIMRWLWVAASAHVTWGVVFLARPSWWAMWVLTLIGLGAVEYGIAKAHEYMLAEVKPHVEAERTQKVEIQQRQASEAESSQVSGPPDPTDIARRAFNRAGYGWLTILGWEPIGTGDDLVGVAFRVAVPSKAGAKKADKTTLSGADIEDLAIAFTEELGVDLESGWVHITKERGAGRYTISVTTVDALARVYPFEDMLERASIKDPARIARQIDGQPYKAQLNQHWADVGQSRGGKTSLIHVKWAHITRCRDAVLWVGGVEKLFDAVGPWIEPYLGTGRRPPIDWVAFGPVDTANMLAAAMSVARWRQSVPHQRRAGFKTLIVQLDEASFFLVLNKVRAAYQGRDMTPSELAAAIVKGAGSGDVWLHLASQRGTHGNWGDHGGDISANVAAQTVFTTGDQAEVGRATGDYKLPIPTHKGEFLFKPGTGEPVVRLKAEYIQETDPTKPRLHDGPTISDVAWARRDFDNELDPGSARAAGEFYANRYTSAEAIYRYLTSTVIDMSEIRSPAYTEAYDTAAAELRAMIAAAGLDITQAEPDPTPSVADLSRHRSRADRIVDIVSRTGGPMSKADIVAALVDGGDVKAGQDVQVVTNALTKLVGEGRLHRPESGVYVTQSQQTHKHTHSETPVGVS